MLNQFQRIETIADGIWRTEIVVDERLPEGFALSASIESNRDRATPS
jgi:hypothetical protein